MSATHAALAARRAVVPARASASRRARRVSSRRGRATTTTTRAAVTEPATKITFEDALPSAVKDGASLTCVGAGVREKKIAIINVKVYAVALYVDADACKAALTTGATFSLQGMDEVHQVVEALAENVAMLFDVKI